MADFTFHFVATLVVVYGTGYLLRPLESYGIPLVAVEILAGIVFGSILGVVGPNVAGYDFFVTLAAFGLLLVMFQAGFELELDLIRREPRRVALLGGFTFVVPFLSGIALAFALGFSLFAAYLVGVVVSTTSLGLVHPLLSDSALLDDDAGQLILAVTGVNDVLSIVVLAYGIAATSADPAIGILAVTGVLALFFVVVPVFLLDWIESFAPARLADAPVKTTLLATAMIAWFTERLGIHAVLGGFFAGLLLDEVTRNGPDLEAKVRPVISFAASAFFFYVGLNVDIQALQSAGLTLLAVVVTVGIGSKVVSSLVGGYALDVDGRTTVLLAALMPGRLSISVAAAEVGLARGIISPGLYNAFIVLSTLSVFLSAGAFQYFARSGARNPTG